MRLFLLGEDEAAIAHTLGKKPQDIIYALIPASIGIYGLWRIHNKRLWSTHRFYIGYAALCVSLLLWTGGSLWWSWFNFHGAMDVPYPWWPDLGYGSHQLLFPTVLLLMERSLYQERANLRRYLLSGTIFVLAVALWLLYLRGWHFAHRDDPWKFGFDLLYPVSDWISVHALWRMSNFSAVPKFRPAHAALRFATLGMLILLTADLCFSSTTTLPVGHPYAYYVGSMSDFIFATGFYVLGCGLLSLPLTMRDFFPPSGPSERLRQLRKRLLSILAPQPDESELPY